MPVAAERETTAYPLPYADGVPKEVARLDAQHQGIKDYLGGALAFAPLEGARPKAILELGSGSGSWAVQAAEQFPDAEVLAVDLSPMPRTLLPENLKFQTLDLTGPFPLEPATFDVIHARFVFMHLPKFKDVLSRTMQLLRPGGWLLLEDYENAFYDEGGLGPGANKFWQGFQSHIRKKGVEPLAASAYENVLKDCGYFSEVNAKKVVLSVSKRNENTKISKLSASLLNSFLRGPIFDYPGTTPEIVDQFKAEIDEPGRDMTINLHFTWSRRKA